MEIKPDIETFAKIKVVGVGGSGGSTINYMIDCNIKGVDFMAVNTDAQALHHSRASSRIHIGRTVTRGLGAGMDPEMGRKAAEETQNEIREALKDTDMVFVTCGLGGGTGTGASPLVASVAKELGALTIAVVTKPFGFEGAQRRLIADKGHEELQSKVDTIITIPNDRILQIIEKKTPLLQAFGIVNDVLRQAVQGVAELVTVHGLTNVDFADVKAVMQNAGSALMGIGEGSGENRAAEAAKAAIASPLLELSIDGAKGILFTVTGGRDLGMYELAEAAKIITEHADPNAKIIYGTVIDENMKDEVRVCVIATGFGDNKKMADPVSKFGQNRYNVPASSSLRSVSDLKATVRPAVKRDMPIPPPAPAPQPKSEPADEAPGNAGGDDDLEIPAFIRKKMM